MDIQSDLRSWLSQQELSVWEFALELGVPLKTAQDWVYRGTKPSPENQLKLDEYIVCAHHWVIDTPSGPVSHGTCKVCGEAREFQNSAEYDWNNRRTQAQLEEARKAKRRDRAT